MRIERGEGDRELGIEQMMSYDVGVLTAVPPGRESRVGDVVVRCPDKGQGLQVMLLNRRVYIDDDCSPERYRWRRLRPGERVVITEG